MAIQINTNMASLTAQLSLTNNTNSLNRVMEQLSTGYKVNTAADDAAGLSIAKNMDTNLINNQKAIENIQTANNMMNIAEGSYESISNLIMRIKDLANQAANDYYGKDQKEVIVNEIKADLEEIQRLASSTNFNNKKLVDGSVDYFPIQIGAGSNRAENSVDISDALGNMNVSAGGLNITIGGLSGESPSEDFAKYMQPLEDALNKINQTRSLLGAYSNRITSSKDNLTVMDEGLSSSISDIMDVDVAAASSDMVKYQILQEATTSVLQQANNIPQMVLSLIN